jgi:transposase
MAKHNLVSVDLAKNVFQVCGMTQQQKIAFNKSIKRRELAEFMAKQPPVEVAMEACSSSHYWARQFQAMGHTATASPTCDPLRAGQQERPQRCRRDRRGSAASQHFASPGEVGRPTRYSVFASNAR